jgi:nitrate reductase NapAB chaperone NapD
VEQATVGQPHFKYSIVIDHQVKIQAFRIEPGEIENCLVKHRQIKEVVVIPGNNPGEVDTNEMQNIATLHFIPSMLNVFLVYIEAL